MFLVAPTIKKGALHYGPIALQPGPDHGLRGEALQALGVVGVGVEEDEVVPEPGGDEHPLEARNRVRNRYQATRRWIHEVRLDPYMPNASGISGRTNSLCGDVVSGSKPGSKITVTIVRGPLGEFVPADPRILVSLVSGGIGVSLHIAHLEGGAVGPGPRLGLLVPNGLGRGENVASATKKLF